MTATEGLVSSLRTIASLLAIMGLVAVVEAAVPLHARGSWHKVHVGPNLALTFITLGTSLVFNMALVSILFALDASHVSLLRLLSLPRLATTAWRWFCSTCRSMWRTGRCIGARASGASTPSTTLIRPST